MEDKESIKEYPEIPKGKKIVKKEYADGSIEYTVRHDPYYGEREPEPCWIATAYYGDSYHKNLSVLRQLREKLITEGKCATFYIAINRFYYWVGGTKFGSWWRKGTSDVNSNINLRRVISRGILALQRYLVLFDKFNSRLRLCER